MRAQARIFLLKKVEPRPYQADELCECCGMGATAARVQFDWHPDAHFRACWLCAELLTVQALLGVALKLWCQGKGN